MRSNSQKQWGKVHRWVGKILLGALILNVAWFVWWRMIPMPMPESLLPEVEIAPIQETLAEEIPEWEFEWDGKEYWATPLYTYEVAGLVVSRNTYGSIIDPTNTGSQGRARDLCVVWGDNATKGVYQMMQFHNTNYTCWGTWGRNEAKVRELFKGEELGNNHLITDNPRVRAKINSIDRGDQIRIKGYLVEYGKWEPNGEKYVVRKSSTTRVDTGNGACETVFVEEIEVIKKNYPVINAMMLAAKKLLLILFVVWMVSFGVKIHLNYRAHKI